MQSNTDLTLFWLAWRKTCSIRLCCPGHERDLSAKCSDAPELCAQISEIQRLATEVLSSMNNYFRKTLAKEERGARISEFDSESQYWKEGQDNGSAFELLESYLYNKQSINGKAFKAYLFEDAAMRPGGMNKNLFGYLQKVMASMIYESYGENVYMPTQDADGNDIEPTRISLDGQNVLRDAYTPDECLEAKDVELSFRKFIQLHDSDWDDDHWLILYCILNLLRVGSANIQLLFRKKHSVINIWYSEMRSELLAWLSDGVPDTERRKAIGMALNGRIQHILNEKVCAMPWYRAAQKILEENRESTGK